MMVGERRSSAGIRRVRVWPSSRCVGVAWCRVHGEGIPEVDRVRRERVAIPESGRT